MVQMHDYLICQIKVLGTEIQEIADCLPALCVLRTDLTI